MSTLALVGTLCFLVGVLIGVVVDDAYEMLRDRQSGPKAVGDPRPLRWLRANSLILVVAAFAASQVLLAFLLIQQRAATADYVQCSVSWQQQFSASYAARVNASRVVSDALDELIYAVADEERGAFRKALRHYIDVRNQQRAAQEANPLPEPPQEACGQS